MKDDATLPEKPRQFRCLLESDARELFSESEARVVCLTGTMSMAAATRSPALVACAVTHQGHASSRPPRAQLTRSASMSWSSMSSRRRHHRPVLAKRLALVRDGHAHSHSHGTNDSEKTRDAHSHSHGDHAHSHSHGDGVPSFSDVGVASWPRTGRDENAASVPYAFRRNEPLPRGAGAGLCLFVDAYTAGIAGDMFVAALLDLGVPLRAITDQLNLLEASGFTGYRLEAVHSEKSCVVAPRFVVVETLEPGSRGQPTRDYAEIRRMLESTEGLLPGVREKAAKAFAILARGEAQVHGVSEDSVHFHEVGAVDSVVDIVAAAAAVEYLGVTCIEISPLPMGRGIVKGAAHGPLPSPPPAVVSCLCGSGLETFDAGADGEFVTPTGACLVAALGSRGRSTRWPETFVPHRTAYGAGTKTWEDRPNLLRLVLGSKRAN